MNSKIKDFLRKLSFPLLTMSIIAVFTIPAFSQTNNVKQIEIKIHNAVKNSGTVYITAFLSEKTYKNRTPDYSFKIAPSDNIITSEINLPLGDYVISAYQDINGNGKCDSNIIGIPKEPVGITNWNGKGHPDGFDKIKITISQTTKTVNIHLYKH